MLEKYYSYLFIIMKWSFNIKRRSKKKGMHIYKYEGVKILTLNDYPNRRLIVWYFKESTKQIYRVCYHGYHVRPLRKKITENAKAIMEDENFFNEKIMSRRSYSYKRERAFKSYINYKARMNS